MNRLLMSLGAVAVIVAGLLLIYTNGRDAGMKAERARWEARVVEQNTQAIAEAWEAFTEAVTARQTVLQQRAEIAAQAAQIDALGAVRAPTDPKVIYVEVLPPDVPEPVYDCGWLRDAVTRTDDALAALAAGTPMPTAAEPGIADTAAASDAPVIPCTIAGFLNDVAYLETTYRREMARFVRLQREVQ